MTRVLVVSVADEPGNSRYNKTGRWRYYDLRVDTAKCTKCGLCSLWCPDAAIYEVDGAYTIDGDYCKGCGICMNECPRQAISRVE